MPERNRRNIGGGQTGIARAALVAAMTYSIKIGGWLPRGRTAENGVAPGN